MKRLIIAVLSLSASLVGLAGAVPALAQGPVVFDDASGADGTCTATGSPGDQMIVCTDLRPGRGVTVIDPGAESTLVSKDVPPTPAPAPDAESAPETTDTVVATATDQDADNAPDELEPGLGLDPTNPDTDSDGVADGDEPNLYGTDPLNGDTDGDGVSDGEELFGIHTDPLVWNDFSAQGAGSTAEAP
jgi:Bacterial TSP3 repeat